MPNKKGPRFTPQQLAFLEARRQFLKQLTSAVGTAAAIGMVTGPLGMREAFAKASKLKRRRHLVTIQATADSGWDTQSFHFSNNHNFMDPADKITVALPEGEVEYKQWTPRDVQIGATTYGHMDHPNYPGSPFFAMGPGGNLLMQDNLLKDYVQIWGGHSYLDGGHGISVYTYNGGMRSQYASSFSTLVADSTARVDYLRPLHYVQIAGPGAIRGFKGMLEGPGVPIQIPDQSTWDALTAPPAASPLVAQQSVLQATLGNLVGIAQHSRLAKAGSKELFASYLSVAHNLQWTRGLGTPAAKAELAALAAAYSLDIMNTLAAHPYGMRLTPTVLAQQKASADAHGFRFALAETLIVKDLSAVVDVPGYFGDYHDGNAGEQVKLLMNFVGMRRLMQKLKATPANDGSGTNLLDSTLLCMYSEFDRTPHLSYAFATGVNNPGTGHGATSSVVMAGYGVNGGRVVGGLLHSPAAGAPSDIRDIHNKFQYTGGLDKLGNPALRVAARGNAMTPGESLPINYLTGEPDPNGKYCYIENLVPTVCKIFGVTLPMQQKTAHHVIPALVKDYKYHKDDYDKDEK